MILIYSAAASPRLNYVLRLLDREFFAIPLRHTTDAAEFLSSDAPKIQYGGSRIPGNCFYLPAVTLLFETDLRAQHLKCTELAGLPVFFSGEGDLAFDLFAGIFFLLSRYEEWLPFSPDEYGRFPPEASLAAGNGFLRRPLVDEWLQLFQQKLAARFPALPFRPHSFRFLPTYDIDMAWSYTGKGFARNAARLVGGWLKGDRPSQKDRRLVLSGSRQDPFDSFSWLHRLHETCQLQPRYFFLLAARTGRLDKNISPEYPAMRELVKEHARRYATGIHPSFQSGDNPALLAGEIATLRQLSGEPVKCSRQHYLRLSMPVTYGRLLDAGIRNDFTMGYGPVNGFRASYTGDFYWYDLEKEITTDLLLTPFCFMDAAAYYGGKKNAAEALEDLRELRDAVARVNGRLVTLWHNQFLGTAPAFDGWRAAYETFVLEVSGHQRGG